MRDYLRTSDRLGDLAERIRQAQDRAKTAPEGTCPFCHAGRFRLSAERGLYSCLDCGEKGDVITATMKINNLDFRSAISRLQARASCCQPVETGSEAG